MAAAVSKLTDLINRSTPIVEYVGAGAEFLRKTSKPVLDFSEDLQDLVEAMTKIMNDAHGIGLAAPQVGIHKRIFIYDVGDGVQALINPKIVQTKGEQIGEEGCLSIPGLRGDVPRSHEVVVKAMDQFGKPIRIRGSALTARVIQHELDHLDGVLFIDKVDATTLHYLTPEELQDERESDASIE